jgi:hypothetical protein
VHANRLGDVDVLRPLARYERNLLVLFICCHGALFILPSHFEVRPLIKMMKASERFTECVLRRLFRCVFVHTRSPRGDFVPCRLRRQREK